MAQGNRRTAVVCASSLFAALAVACGDAGRERHTPPNLVLIVSDDQGYRDHGFAGSPHVRTPNLDRLADEGTLFTHALATASVCRPSLRSLLTGLEPLQWVRRLADLESRGMRRAPGEEIRDFQTLPRLLGEQGYASFMAGKLWERTAALAGFAEAEPRGDRPLYVDTPLGRPSIEPVARFLDAVDEPFFLWFAPQLPHTPHDAPERFVAPYRRKGLSAEAVAYYANIARFDEVVGALLDALETRGLTERTLVVYVVDNGWDQGPRATARPGRDGPRGKMSIRETGFRTPLLFRWPGHVPQGAVRGELVSLVDLYPTLLDFAGAPVPNDVTGRSLRPLLEDGGPWGREQVIGWMPIVRPYSGRPGREPEGPVFFVRNLRWRYTWQPETGIEELYDMQADPGELENVARAHPGVARGLRRTIVRWEDSLPRAAGPASAE